MSTSGIQHGDGVLDNGLVFYVDAFNQINGVNNWNPSATQSVWYDLSGNGGDINMNITPYITDNNGLFTYTPPLAAREGTGQSNALNVGAGGNTTIEIFFKFPFSTDGLSSNNRPLFQYGTNNTSNTGGASYTVAVNRGASSNFQLRIALSTGSSEPIDLSSTNYPTSNIIHCFTITMGSSKEVYYTGSFLNSHNFVPSSSAGDLVRVGFARGGVYSPARTCVGIQIGSIKVWNRILTADEILQSYNTTKGRYGL
jgi:hypothetical protein